LACGDCVSTYLVLTTPTETYRVWEGNVLSAWLFAQVGLVQGLALATTVKALMLAGLYRLVARRADLRTLAVLGMAFAINTHLWANLNNWYIWGVIRP
jgi:hypothetical protein